MAPIPVALCGKNPNLATSFTETMGPEYYVSHVFHTTSRVRSELPSLLAGQATRPASQLGTNATCEPVPPKAIIVGAGFSREELDQMRELEGAKAVPWLYPSTLKMAQTGASVLVGKDFMTSIVERAKASMKQNGLVEGKEEEAQGGVWFF